MNIVFYIASAVALFSTVMVVTRLNAIHALLYLIVSFLSIALIFFMLGAPLIAALEVIIYAGAIMVLFLFVIMMLNLGSVAIENERHLLQPTMWIGPSLLSVILLALLVYGFAGGELTTAGTESVGPREVGVALFGPYMVGVQLAGLLLLAGIVGASHLGRRKTEAEQPGESQP